MTSRSAAPVIVLSMTLMSLPYALGAQEVRADLPERVQGAAQIVVGVIIDIEPVLQESEFGDQLIVSHTTVEVQEVLKGPPNLTTVVLEVEGGSLGGRTLLVSDIEPVEVDERGVFFVSPGASGANVPHLRGQGILKLDAQNQVIGEPWSLGDIRAEARGQAANP